MLEFVASSRPVFHPATLKVTCEVPEEAELGDLLVVVLVSKTEEPPDEVIAGWTLINSVEAGDQTAHLLGHIRQVGDDDVATFPYAAVTGEVQGQMIAFRGGHIHALVESSGGAPIELEDVLPVGTGALAAIQATCIHLALWSIDSDLPITVTQVDFVEIDNYTTALLATRTLALAYGRANETGNFVAFGGATTEDDVSGSSVLFTLRDRPPVVPATLFDVVPGNLGLIARDTRPPREVTRDVIAPESLELEED